MKHKYLKFEKLRGLFLLPLAFMSMDADAQVITQTYSYTGSMQSFTVPFLCVPTITIEVLGASGGSTSVGCVSNGGLGAGMKGEFNVTTGQVFNILVGQQGPTNNSDAGGGGGSFVVSPGNVPVIIAGGGGGATNDINRCGSSVNPNRHGLDASITTSATASANGQALGGVNGNGGAGAGGGGGGGLLTDGTPSPGTGGKAFVNGAAGGTGGGAPGGYGGGGGGYGTGGNGGGGGGYSGGGTSVNTAPYTGGGGGGSYNSGANQVNTPGARIGNGLVTISYITGAAVSAVSSATSICSGAALTLTASGVSTYTWLPVNTFTGSNAAIITHSPSVNTSYTVRGTNGTGCVSTAVITVTVNGGVPSLTVTSSASSASVCMGNTLSLTGSGALTYTWTNNGVSNGVSFLPSATAAYTLTGGNACGNSSVVTTISVNPLPILVSASSTLVCAAIATTLNAGGATTYTWMPGNSTQTNYITNPTANTVYTVTGKTGNCLGVNTITITTKPNPTITIIPTSTFICAGGSANLTANGAISYTWNPVVSSNTTIAVSPTLSTLYTVVGTNAVNCNSSASQVVIVNARPVITVTASDPLVCPGGGSTLTATGANTYLWGSVTPGTVLVVNPTSTTTYTVEGTGLNTCSSATMITVTVFDPTLSLSSSTAVCRGINVNISASGMDTYQWSTGSGFSSISVTPTITTTYSVNSSSTQGAVTCSVSGAVTVSVNPNPTITAISSPTIICKGESAVITASGAVTYTWAGSTPTESAVITVTPSADQSYTVAGVDANGCKGTGSIFLRVAGCVGISANLSDAADLSVYPNPSNGDFTISSEKAIDLNITNELGQQVKTISLTHDTKEVKVSGLSSGIYFISGKNENGTVKQKIIITK